MEQKKKNIGKQKNKQKTGDMRKLSLVEESSKAGREKEEVVTIKNMRTLRLKRIKVKINSKEEQKTLAKKLRPRSAQIQSKTRNFFFNIT